MHAEAREFVQIVSATLKRAGLGDSGAGSWTSTQSRERDDGPHTCHRDRRRVERRRGPARRPAGARDDALLERLRGCCKEVSVSDDDRNEAGRDWWPIAIRWATNGLVPSTARRRREAADPEEVAAVLAAATRRGSRSPRPEDGRGCAVRASRSSVASLST